MNKFLSILIFGLVSQLPSYSQPLRSLMANTNGLLVSPNPLLHSYLTITNTGSGTPLMFKNANGQFWIGTTNGNEGRLWVKRSSNGGVSWHDSVSFGIIGSDFSVEGTEMYLGYGDLAPGNGIAIMTGLGVPSGFHSGSIYLRKDGGVNTTLYVNSSDGTWTPVTTGSGEVNTASNVGATGEGLFKQKSGVDLEFKKIVAGDNITLDSDADTVTINSSGSGGGVETVYINGDPVGNTDEDDTTLMTASGTLINAGESIHITASGSFANNATAKSVRITFVVNGVTRTVFNTGSIVFTNGKWRIEADVCHVSSEEVLSCGSATTTGNATTTYTSNETGGMAEYNGNYVVNVMSQSGVGGANDDTICNFLKVVYYPSP